MSASDSQDTISFFIDKSLTGDKDLDSRAIKFHVQTWGIRDGSGRKMYSVEDWTLNVLFSILMEVDEQSCELRVFRENDQDPSSIPITLHKLKDTTVFAHSPTLRLIFPVPIPAQHVMPQEEYDRLDKEKMKRIIDAVNAKRKNE